VNGLSAAGYSVDYYGAEAPPLVNETANVLSADSFVVGLLQEANLYQLHEVTVAHLKKLVRSRRYSFIYERMSLGQYCGVALSRHLNVPYVLEYNGSDTWCQRNWGRGMRFPTVAGMVEKVCLRHAHLVVTVSKVLKAELIQRGVEPQRIVYYPNCIDPTVYDANVIGSEDKAILRRKLGVSPNAVVVGFIGTFGQWHGVDILSEAICSLASHDTGFLDRHDVHFLLIGDGVRMPEVRRILSDGSCQRFVTLTGLVPQAEAPKYLALCDILISPHVPNPDGTPFFGSPTKLFEYMAMAKGIIASDLGQIGEVLQGSLRAESLPTSPPSGKVDHLAVLTSPGNVEELLWAIRFMVTNPIWRNQLGQNAKAKALAYYTWDRHVEGIINGLQSVR
jgi:glycosyltransferase involved in cell wall biosynthesis